MAPNASLSPALDLIGIVRAAAVLAMTVAGGTAMAHDPVQAGGDAAPEGQTCNSAWAAAPVVFLAEEPPPRLIVDAPVHSQLAEGRVVIRYCAENARILPVFGEAALNVSPRLAHLHVTVDDGPYRWLDTSGQPIIVNRLPPGPHTILIELVDPTHKTIDRQVVSFTIPRQPGQH